MAKFMFVYRGGDDSEKSPEEMQQVMQIWMNWIEQGSKAGWILDGGDALKPGGRVVHSESTITDGPFAESKELVGGYSMIEAADYDAAVEYAKTSPMITQHSGIVEIRELMGTGEG
jgi:hypothetical protein